MTLSSFIMCTHQQVVDWIGDVSFLMIMTVVGVVINESQTQVVSEL